MSRGVANAVDRLLAAGDPAGARRVVDGYAAYLRDADSLPAEVGSGLALLAELRGALAVSARRRAN